MSKSTRLSIGRSTPRSSDQKDSMMTTPRAMQEKLDTMKNLAKGGNILDAVVAFASGHKMTDLQASVMLQRAYRRFSTQQKFQADKEAALKIQSMKRGQEERQIFLDQKRAASKMAAGWNGKQDRDKARVLRAVVRIQAAWRGRVGRVHARGMGGARGTRKAKRSLSFRKNKEKKEKPEKTEEEKAAKPSVRRTMSFDMKKKKAPVAPPSVQQDYFNPTPTQKAQADAVKQLLFVFLTKGPDGLGLELDATNTILQLLKGGAAAKQGTLQVGDTISSVDGQPLRGRLLQDVMDPERSCFSFDVWRIPTQPAGIATPVKEKSKIKRTLSWDRRK